MHLIITNRKANFFKKTCTSKTGISDFHKLTAVSLKSQILQALPKRVFDENSFNNDLKSKLDSMKNLDYSSSEDKIITANNRIYNKGSSENNNYKI